MILLSGPPSSYSSLLLTHTQFPVELAKSLTFLQREDIAALSGIDPSSSVLDRIQMKYVDDEDGINKFFAAFHMHDVFPVLVIIDDLGEFFDERTCQQKHHSPRGRELAIVRTLALCQNAINHANETGHCMLLLSDTHHGDTPRFLHIYKRWVNSIYTIKGDGIGSYILKSNSVRAKSAKYSISLQYLVLEAIYENEEQSQIC
ncbi:hypothetical protein E3N88_00477 [Mikania micrantha]|uniref:ATPase AAA-type core domain-containing protein n=1 Tax=Mikania micrantha TaxID=192012 RepID=A0A5N6Q049_9ASTR|nr:hypothetical protein E3N88_00477 [Mikania micrantha]